MKEATCGKCSALIGWDDTPNPICLSCEREEDRAAIRAMADVLVLFLHPFGDEEPPCSACRVAKDHAAAIARAQGTSHE